MLLERPQRPQVGVLYANTRHGCPIRWGRARGARSTGRQGLVGSGGGDVKQRIESRLVANIECNHASYHPAALDCRLLLTTVHQLAVDTRSRNPPHYRTSYSYYNALL
ncbi:unnamed protein product [Ectocarpus sp. CCAP 1310/34]|nr:unnamed protein product [Ectocarpus sp. CCAP 1310/34]